MREIGKSTIYFLDGEVALRKQILPAKPFSKLNIDRGLLNTFATIDIETIKLDSKLVPYLICGYNGTEYISSYGKVVEGVINQSELFSSFFNQLLTFFSKDSKKLIVYAHNLSTFDGIFLLRHILPYGTVKPLLFNGRLMSIKVKLTVAGHVGKTIYKKYITFLKNKK